MSVSEKAGKLFDLLKRQKQDYQLACHQPAMQRMLIDLMWYGKWNETCVVYDKGGRLDKAATLVMQGRREMIIRILNHCNLTTKQLYLLATGKEFNPGENL